MRTNDQKQTQERASVETGVTIKLGLDVHAEKTAICVQIGGQTPKPAQLIERQATLDWIEKLRAKHPQAQVISCYEAGPLGYALHRELTAAQITNYVVTPQRMDDLGRRQKTDRVDAKGLVNRLDRYVGGNRSAFSLVRVPTLDEEQKRAQVRLRSQLKTLRRQCEGRGRSALLLQGIRVVGPWWRPKRWAQLQGTLPPWLRELVRTFQELACELDKRERAVRALLEAAAPPLLPRAVGALSWTVLSREIVDWGRFKNRRQVASYTGLCPGTAQSGGSRRDGAINRCGNPVVRHVLVEMVWRLARFQPGYPPIRRLVSETLSPRQRRKCVVAAARRLAIDLWRWATGQCSAEKLGLGTVVPPA